MKNKGLSLVELLISMTILSIVLVVIIQIWLSIQRDVLINRIDSELERGVSLAISNLNSDILKASVIYTPGFTIYLQDNSGSNYGFGTFTSFITGSQALVLAIPIRSNIYRFNIYITRQRTGSLYDSANPNARFLLKYSIDLSWTPTYSSGNITNLRNSFTFTSTQKPILLTDYIDSDGFIVKYLYLDLIPGHSNVYSYFELTPANYTSGRKVQLVDISIKAKRRIGNTQRERTATITLSPATF
ncbi:MAG: prepilin-type N-terminal cleavage/methylation domain-containing protein [Dictyoglomus sp.]|nr:prepilin-type N-terminal cleavage/methylation domain-containing protein [Dictyoglomus sp.]MDW8188697.1 prepilin-type N-terminal cleavage/methylation domain-containing protein [Dictyoglomus sp.]